MRLGKPALVLVPLLLLLLAAAPALLLLLPQLRMDSPGRSDLPPAPETVAQATQQLRALPVPFVPNLGQWKHRARFVHRSGPMTLFLEDRGWVLDLVERTVERKAGADEPWSLAGHRAMSHEDKTEVEVDQKTRGVAVRMTFEGEAYLPENIGEEKLSGHHNYFLGNDESRWRTGVPLYGSVRYENLYPGIDLRLREANGVPEYDLLLQPGADLVAVTVHVEGGQGLSIASDGSLVIETALGPLTQSVPKTWQVGHDGRKREVVCSVTLLGVDRFGFAAPGWDGDTNLTIDPGLIWSTFLGGGGYDSVYALSVDASGVVTVAGEAWSTNFPTTSGAYDTTYNNGDAFVSRLDPSKTGTAQLVYSTFLGGSWNESVLALSVDAGGVVTVAGGTTSADYPTTSGAYDTTYNGGGDVFVSRLDPSKTGTAQLVYSTFLGGSGRDFAYALAVGASGVVTVAGETYSTNFPTTPGAYDRTHNGSTPIYRPDAFVSRLDMLPTGVSAFGRSSPGCKGPLAISVASMPRIGNANFAVTCGNAPPSANGVLGLGVARLTTPRALLGTGVWVDLNAAFIIPPTRSNAVGAASLALPIPNLPGLANVTIYTQFLFGGPNWPPPCPSLGFSASNALAITIQP